MPYKYYQIDRAHTTDLPSKKIAFYLAAWEGISLRTLEINVYGSQCLGPKEQPNKQPTNECTLKRVAGKNKKQWYFNFPILFETGGVALYYLRWYGRADLRAVNCTV